MNKNKDPKKNMNRTLDVSLEFVSSENWQMRLLKAFEMLLEGENSSSLTRQARMLQLGHRKRKE